MKVRYTLRARADLQAIYSRIYGDNPQGALNVRTAIRKATELIARAPRRGHKTDAPDVLRVPVIRYRYSIYFRARGDEIQIVHIRHSSRQWPKAEEL